MLIKKMCLLQEALKNNDVDMVIWLLKCDPQLMNDELSDGTTCKDKLIELNEYTYVLSQIA